MNAHNESSITRATLISEAERTNALPRHFGQSLLTVESKIYSFMRELVPSYRGGWWRFYELSNSGFYMAPDMAPGQLVVHSNGFEGMLSADAAGITVCLFAYSHLSFQFQSDRCFGDHFHI